MPYLGNKGYAVWRCPADLSTVGGKPRVRSNSMSQVFAGGVWLPSPPYRVYGKTAQVVNPIRTFVLLDEHPDSINDAAFASAMYVAGGFSTSASIVDFPASSHNGACGFAFADGHSEIHKWKGSKIKAPVQYNNDLKLNVDAGDSKADIEWLSSVTTVRQ